MVYVGIIFPIICAVMVSIVVGFELGDGIMSIVIGIGMFISLAFAFSIGAVVRHYYDIRKNAGNCIKEN